MPKYLKPDFLMGLCTEFIDITARKTCKWIRRSAKQQHIFAAVSKFLSHIAHMSILESCRNLSNIVAFSRIFSNCVFITFSIKISIYWAVLRTYILICYKIHFTSYVFIKIIKVFKAFYYTLLYILKSIFTCLVFCLIMR